MLKINVESKNFLEDMITNYIQMDTANNIHINYGIEQLASYLNYKRGKVTVKNWNAYFDFLNFANNQAKFDKAVESYTKVTKKSPPEWRNLTDEEKNEATNVIKFTNLRSITPAKIKDFIETIKNEKSYSRIDFSNTDFDNEKMEDIVLLTELFHEIRGKKCQILGQINIINFLEQKLQEEKEYWLLLLKIYQCVGNQSDYEKLSMEYIDKFEESVLDYDDKFVLSDFEEEVKTDILEMPKEITKTDIIQFSYFLTEKLMQFEKIIEVDFKKTQFIHYSALEELSKFILNNIDLIKEKTIVFKNVNQVTLSSMEVMGIDFNLITCKMIKY